MRVKSFLKNETIVEKCPKYYLTVALWFTVKHPKSCVRIEAGKRVSVIREKERNTESERERNRERTRNLQNNIHGDRIAGKRFHYIQRYH